MTASLIFRRPGPEDAGPVSAYMAEPQIYSQLLQLPYPTEAFGRERFSKTAGPDSLALALLAEWAGQVVGVGALTAGSTLVRRRHAVGLALSVASSAQGQGVGSALLVALIDYAGRWTPILRIELQVFIDDERAIKPYRRHGFIEEGCLRGYALRDGQYVDCLMMARWRPSHLA